MNKYFYFLSQYLVVCLISVTTFAEKNNMATSDESLNTLEWQFYLPLQQLRYEDTESQLKEMQAYLNWTQTMTFNKKYVLGFEYNQFSDNTGNASLGINRLFQELNIIFGLPIWGLKKTESVSVNLMAYAYLGQNKNTIKTILLDESRIDTSQNQTSFGVSTALAANLKQFLFEVELRGMTSASYEPQFVTVTTVRLGYSFKLE